MTQTLANQSFATCDLCDAHKQNKVEDFRSIAMVFKRFGAAERFSGPVQTIKCYEDNTLVKAAVESPGHGRVLVVDGGASLRRALLGGNLGLAAANNGWAGLLIDGCVRDIAELAPLPIGILALASQPMPTDRKGQGLGDIAVQIQGVWVNPGDLLFADPDGIVLMAAKA
jgi:regulator of ribonuclease activity A